MTGHAGLFAGGDMVPARAERDGRHRPRQAGRAPASTPGCAASGLAEPRRQRGRELRSPEHVVLRGCPRHRAPAAGGRPPRGRTSTRCSSDWMRRTRCSRPAAACPAATASSATTATGSAPTTPSSSSRRRARYEIDYDYCKGCGICGEECPCGAIRMEPEPELTPAGVARPAPRCARSGAPPTSAGSPSSCARRAASRVSPSAGHARPPARAGCRRATRARRCG